MCAEGSAMIRGKSRMRESRSYGSVRGVPGNRHPYRDPSRQRRERGARVPRHRYPAACSIPRTPELGRRRALIV